MSSSASPILVGLFAAGLLLALIWVVSATYRLVARFRLHRRSRADGKTTSETWIDRPRVPDEKLGERSSPTADADATGPGAPKVEAGRITDDAPEARELLEEAALEAKRNVVAAGPAHTSQQAGVEQAAPQQTRMRLDVPAANQEAEGKADELLLGADRGGRMPITPAEIRQIDLPRAWLRGYPRGEVDGLLEEIATSFEEVSQERARLDDRLRKLEVEDEKHRELERLLHSTLVSAEGAAGEMKAQAIRESDLIVQEAHAESRRTTRELAAEKRRLEDDVALIRAQLQTALEELGERPRSESTPSDDLASATERAAIEDDLDSGVRKVVS